MCKSVLPSVFTLDYVPWDMFAYRVIKGIDPETENEILKARHPLYQAPPPYQATDAEEYILLNNVDDVCRVLRAGLVVNRSKYAIMCQNGLSFYEGLQNRQYWYILINIWWELDTWVEFRKTDSQISVFDEDLFAPIPKRNRGRGAGCSGNNPYSGFQRPFLTTRK